MYESKESDCWIYIWIVLDMSPDHHYKKKHVLPGAIIPGPKKPKIIDSFLFPASQAYITSPLYSRKGFASGTHPEIVNFFRDSSCFSHVLMALGY